MQVCKICCVCGSSSQKISFVTIFFFFSPFFWVAEPSVSESQGKGSLSEDELISAIKEAKSFSFETPEVQRSPAVSVEKRDQRVKPGRPAASSPLDNEASSAESGDSEIELVSEDPLAAEEVLHSNYMTFSHIGGPPPSPASPSIQYSILREEREAELDSELIIESCDASSASEESPKREQDSPLMKPMVMDIIKEENGSRTDASDYEASKAMESRMNRENLAESTSYLKCDFVAPRVSAETPTSAVSTEELKERIILKKPIEETVVNQSKVSSKDSGKRSPLASPLLPFLNKQKGKCSCLCCFFAVLLSRGRREKCLFLAGEMLVVLSGESCWHWITSA